MNSVRTSPSFCAHAAIGRFTTSVTVHHARKKALICPRFAEFYAATVALVTSDHGPFSPRVLTQRKA